VAEPPDLARFRYPRQTEAIVNVILASAFNKSGELAALRYQALISAPVQRPTAVGDLRNKFLES
jgi:hypothetical protein